MKGWGVFAILALCVTLCVQKPQGEPPQKQTIDASSEAAHVDRKQNPIDVARNISTLILSSLPQEEIKEKAAEIKQSALSFLKNITHPANVRELLHLIRDSKIPKKGEIIRITLSFMNPENLKPEGVVHTLKTLDPLTVSEMTGIMTQYFKLIEPQVLGHDFDWFLKYINDEDLKAIVLQLFEIFQETEESDLLWILETLRSKKDEVKKGADQLLHAEGQLILDNWHNNAEQTIKEKVQSVVSNVQKFIEFEKITAHIPLLTVAFRNSAIHIIQTLILDFRNASIKINPKEFIKSINETIQNAAAFVQSVLEVVDVNKIGKQAQETVEHFKSINRTVALQSLETFKMLMPTVDDLIERLNDTKNIFLQSLNKEKVRELLVFVNKTKIPEPLINIGIDSFLAAARKVDAEKVKSIIELLAKQSQVNNEVYTVFRSIFVNLVKDKLNVFSRLNMSSANSWDEIEKVLVNRLQSINESAVESLVKEFVGDLKSKDASVLADVAGTSVAIMKTVLNDNFTKPILDDPYKVFNVVNETLIANTVYLFLDVIKNINEDSLYRRCNGLASLANDDLINRLDGFNKRLIDQFARVENGQKIVDKFKLNDTAAFFKNFIVSQNFSEACLDMKLLVSGSKHFNAEARAEAADLGWKAFKFLKYVVETKPYNNVDKELLLNAVELLQGLLRAIIKSKGYKADDYRAATVRLAIRRVRRFAEKSNITVEIHEVESDEVLIAEADNEPEEIRDFEVTEDGWMYSSKFPLEETSANFEDKPVVVIKPSTPAQSKQTEGTSTTITPSTASNYPTSTTSKASASTTAKAPASTTAKAPASTTSKATASTTSKAPLKSKNPPQHVSKATTTSTPSSTTTKPTYGTTGASAGLYNELYENFVEEEDLCWQHVREMFSLSHTGEQLSEQHWKFQMYNSKYGLYQQASTTTPSKIRSCILMNSLEETFTGQYCNVTDTRKPAEDMAEVLGLCIPSTCTEVGFNKAFRGNLTVVPGSCRLTQEPLSKDYGNWGWVAVGLVAALAMLGGVTEYRKKFRKTKSVTL